MDESSSHGVVFNKIIMSEYPPQNPPGTTIVPHRHPDQVAVTGADQVGLFFLIASVLIFLGIWAIVYVGKQSDRHHKDDE